MARAKREAEAILKPGVHMCAHCDHDTVHARNLCQPCYRYWNRTGKLPPAKLIYRRFLANQSALVV